MTLLKINTNKTAFYLLAILFALLPFHAFLVTFTNSIFFDNTSSAPLFLRMWKEGIIFLIAVIFCWKILFEKYKPRLITLDYVILTYFLLGFLSTVFITQDLKIAIFGAKYDFEFLGLYLIIRQFSFSKRKVGKLFKIIITAASVVIIFGLLQKLILPETFLTLFGYSAKHSFFSPNEPLAFCQKISHTETCRIQSFLSGPNQLGSYLLVVLPLFLIPLWQKLFIKEKNSWLQKVFKKVKNLSFLSFLRKRESYSKDNPPNHLLYKNLTIFLVGILTLIFTYSRASWLGFSAMFLAGIILLIKNKKILWLTLSALFVTGILSIFILQFTAPDYFNEVIFRASSTQGHGERMADGIKFSLENPLGLGLGNAGPASNHFSKDFLGFIPESWYLQVSLELGVLGIILYLCILGFTLKALYHKYKQNDFYAFSLLLSLIGIIIASSFLHTWEDSSTALVFWGMVGVVLGKSK